MKNETESIPSVGPKISTLWFSTLEQPNIRLDSKHYQDEFIYAKNKINHCGFDKKYISEFATAFVPDRSKLVLTRDSVAGPAYLKAHDAFEVRPNSRRYISKVRMEKYEELLLKEGMILTPSSGRNLGPLAYVGKKLSEFAMTDIMRIAPFSLDDGYYLFAFLLTPTGQAMIRRGRTGTNVDHLSPADVLSIPIVVVDKKNKSKIVKNIKESQDLLDWARLTLDDLDKQFHELNKLKLPIKRSNKYLSGEISSFSQSAAKLLLRIDAAFYDPQSQEISSSIKKSGGIKLGDAASLLQLGRYKRYYVSEQYGRPILSGRHLVQLRQVHLQYISDRSFKSADEFILKQGWTVFTCDGRAEEQLGNPAYVHSGWKGWMASNHVMRAIPKPAMPSGYLYLAIRSPYVQLQIKARATGSVIDALDPESLSDVYLPTISTDEMEKLSNSVEKAWEAIAKAQQIEKKTVKILESYIEEGYEKNIIKS